MTIPTRKMFRPAFNILSAQLRKPCFSARFLHTVDQVPYIAENGLSPLYSPATATTLYKERLPQLLAKVDELSSGTQFESKSLKDIIIGTSIFPEHAALYNNASQAWNLNFYLKSLTDRTHEPNVIVRSIIAKQFSSFKGFQETFKLHALGIFGNGWTWLAMDREGKLFIKNTFNGGSLFSMLPKDFPGLIGDATGTVMKLASRNLKGQPLPNKYYNTTVYPILGLNMWMDSYYPEFKYDREAYIDSFWKVVNWDLVAQRVNIEQIGTNF